MRGRDFGRWRCCLNVGVCVGNGRRRNQECIGLRILPLLLKVMVLLLRDCWVLLSFCLVFLGSCRRREEKRNKKMKRVMRFLFSMVKLINLMIFLLAWRRVMLVVVVVVRYE